MGMPNGMGLPDLGGGAQVVIRSRRILSPASCALRQGGATITGCDVHLEVVDIATGIMYLVPLSPGMAATLHADLGDE